MKAFSLLGILVAAAISTVYLHDVTPEPADSGAAAATAQELPGLAATAVQQSNEQTAALQKVLDENAARLRAENP